MTQSMTAFARQQAEQEWGTLVWEIRSVNHRYLETNIRLPESLRAAEGQCRDLLRKNLSRGKVDAQLKFTPNLASGSISVDQDLLSQINLANTEISKLMPELQQPTTLDILRWPGIAQESKQEAKNIESALVTLFKDCLQGLQEQRQKEGAHLKSFIEQRLDSITSIVEDIKTAMPDILQSQHAKLKDTLADLSESLDPARLEQEMVLLAQKADISEETDRLQAHVHELRSILSQSGAVGRKLDFLMQELNREANTICSKAVVIETTLNAVELKVLIEQMREQIQNIE
ncbi:MAG: YicC family protein [Gammaproteobacteria bacterium]|nr:YicC family protein [Gammaproteobacteria bacterium]